MSRHPYTLLHASGPLLIAVFGRDFDVLSLADGAAKLVASTRPRPGHVSIPSAPQERILASALSGDGALFAVSSDDKVLRIWRTATWELHAAFQAPRRPSSLAFSESGTHLIEADKFGDVYRYNLASAEEPEPLLGQTSLITDVLTAGGDRYIITADRDEKIRVSMYPRAYIIHSYCLGHTHAVTKLHKPSQAPGLLVSGGGDGRVLLWDYVAGKCLQAFDLEELRQAPLVANETLDVLAITSSARLGVVAVAVERSDLVYLFRLEGTQLASLGVAHVVVSQAQDPPAGEVHVTALAFDASDRLWVATDRTSPEDVSAGGLLQALSVELDAAHGARLVPDRALSAHLAHGVWPAASTDLDPANPPVLFQFAALRKHQGGPGSHGGGGGSDDDEGEDDDDAGDDKHGAAQKRGADAGAPAHGRSPKRAKEGK